MADEQEFKRLDARIRLLSQQREVLQHTQKAAINRKSASVAAQRVAANQRQAVEDKILLPINSEINEQLANLHSISKAIGTQFRNPPDGTFAFLSDFDALVRAQADFTAQHEAWTRRQFEEVS